MSSMSDRPSPFPRRLGDTSVVEMNKLEHHVHDPPKQAVAQDKGHLPTAFSRREALRKELAPRRLEGQQAPNSPIHERITRRPTGINTELLAAIQDPTLPEKVIQKRRKSFVQLPSETRVVSPSIGLPLRSDLVAGAADLTTKRCVSEPPCRLANLEQKQDAITNELPVIVCEDTSLELENASSSQTQNHQDATVSVDSSKSQPINLEQKSSHTLANEPTVPFCNYMGNDCGLKSIDLAHFETVSQLPPKVEKDRAKIIDEQTRSLETLLDDTKKRVNSTNAATQTCCNQMETNDRAIQEMERLLGEAMAIARRVAEDDNDMRDCCLPNSRANLQQVTSPLVRSTAEEGRLLKSESKRAPTHSSNANTNGLEPLIRLTSPPEATSKDILHDRVVTHRISKNSCEAVDSIDWGADDEICEAEAIPLRRISVKAAHVRKAQEDEFVVCTSSVSSDDEPVSPKHDSHTSTNDEVPLMEVEVPRRTNRIHSLKNRHHHTLHGRRQVNLNRFYDKQPIARDWSERRKSWVAMVACLNTSLIGLIVGIYAGEVPAIQYVLGDQHHLVVFGNVIFYLGIAIPTLLLWPLPLLHGRRTYILIALSMLLPLQLPQAISVQTWRTQDPIYRVGLLVPRAFSGIAAGLLNINCQATLLDLFGASLQSSHPHQEVITSDDVRRHGGGMGMWLGWWCACYIGSISVGFLVGASIINNLQVAWGFWVTTTVIAFMLLLNVVTPEVRRALYRRSVAEVLMGTRVATRVGRGELRMHVYSTGPKHWWEEVDAGMTLSWRMMQQTGFCILSIYLGFVYGLIVMIIVLLGSLTSRYYHFRPKDVGLCVLSIAIGALVAVPFQKASLFSRSRRHPARTDSMTFEKRMTWSSHLVRRTIFQIALPMAGLAYTFASSGPPLHYVVPTVFAGLVGYLSALALAECNGLIMETFDTSDLQPGMTGHPRQVSTGMMSKRTNYSCHPRVSAGFAISQTLGFVVAAVNTAVGGIVSRALTARAAAGTYAGLVLIITALLTCVLWRWKEVEVIPKPRFGTMRLHSTATWAPVIIGNPSGTSRRMNVLELGKLSRWSEIVRRNRLTGLSMPK